MRKIYCRTIILFVSIFSITSCAPIKGADELIEGKRLYRRSDYNSAIETLTNGIKKNPGHWKFYIYRGSAYEETNQYDLAIEDLTTSLELIPKGSSYSNLIDEWSRIYLVRGTIYHKKKMYDLAIADYEHAIKLDAKLINAYYCRAEAKEELNMLVAAVEDYTKVVELMSQYFSGIPESEKSKVFFKRGSVYARLENYAKAIGDFDQSIEKHPDTAVGSYIYRAAVRLVSNCDLVKILDDYYYLVDDIMLEDETRMVLYNQIAWILATASNKDIRNADKAVYFAKKSIEIQENCHNLDTLAVASAAKGDFKGALDAHKKAVKLCKSNNPEKVDVIHSHLKYYEENKPIRETCPGLGLELDQLKKWKHGKLNTKKGV
jgi:tetratricopeptide (TPR) repeat protein